MPKNTVRDILLFYVDKQSQLPCWIWIGAITHNGYPKATFNYETCLVHQVIYKHFKGPIPEGLEIDHVCRNKLCVNPEHLEAITHKENVARYAATITHCKKGHPLSGDNLYLTPDERRNCKTCRREAVKRCLERKFA